VSKNIDNYTVKSSNETTGDARFVAACSSCKCITFNLGVTLAAIQTRISLRYAHFVTGESIFE
jgi:hypothetical protein